MIDGAPVIDAVVHAYNLDPSNWANRWADPVGDFLNQVGNATSRPGYRLPPEQFIRDWSMEEVASMTFVESDADLAVHHVLPVAHFKEGLASFAKTLECLERWPDRFLVYAGVDPMDGPAALEELERQHEALRHPPGLKLYPNSWKDESEVVGWRMDDPEIAFPVFQRARELGIKVVAIHKAVPLGPVPLEHYRVDDIDRAAIAFPELTFEIVHGGMAFLEETAWQLARFENVFVNLEITTAYAAVRPRFFLNALATMLQHGGPHALEKIVWGTGCMAYHPQPHLEAFWNDMRFDEETMETYVIPQLDAEAKRKILAGNYARIHRLDLEERIARVADDAFARRRAEGRAAPSATTASAGHAF